MEVHGWSGEVLVMVEELEVEHEEPIWRCLSKVEGKGKEGEAGIIRSGCTWRMYM